MKKLILGLLMLGLIGQVQAQKVELDEVIILATNYKYLNAVDNSEAPVPVKLLEREVAKFNLKEAEFYLDEYAYYQIMFYIPDGKILAAFDKDGKVIRTVEKFKNVALPQKVDLAIKERFPGWTIKKDVYLVKYAKGKSKMEYKVVLVNGDQTIRVKLKPDGAFL